MRSTLLMRSLASWRGFQRCDPNVWFESSSYSIRAEVCGDIHLWLIGYSSDLEAFGVYGNTAATRTRLFF